MPETPSQRQERQVAERLHEIYGRGRAQPGSGNKVTAPNDVAVTNHLHVECKETSFYSMTVKSDWIIDATRKALRFGVRAVLAIRFRPLGQHDFFVISDDYFYHLLECEVEVERRSGT